MNRRYPIASAGIAMRRLHGPLPTDLDASGPWLRQHFSVWLEVCRMPPPLLGVASFCGLKSVLGFIAVSDLYAFPFYTVGHELGHLLYGYSGLHVDSKSWENIHEERHANEFAAGFLIDGDELMSGLRAGMPLGDVSDRFGVPRAVAALRLRIFEALGE